MKRKYRQAMRLKLVLRDALDDTHENCGDCPHVAIGCPNGLCNGGLLEAAFQNVSNERRDRSVVNTKEAT